MEQNIEALVRDGVEAIPDANSGKSLGTMRCLDDLCVDEATKVVKMHVCLHYPAKSYCEFLEAEIYRVLKQICEGFVLKITVSWKVLSHSVQRKLKPMDNVKNIIAVASGKGGVGKSTTAINIALALSQEGARVGLLDADIYGPSQPTMLGVDEKPDTHDGKFLEPIEKFGLQTMSIGYLIEKGAPMIWRGPMVTQALEQMLHSTNWKDMDYLIVDMPPGTGDTHLTLAQKIPVSGAVIVTTPQEVALIDARKGVKMFERVEVPVLGIVENMSTYVCRKCGHEEAIFGYGGGEEIAREFGVAFLGSLPLDPSIREQADYARPPAIYQREGNIAMDYAAIARRIAAILALQKKDYSGKFPKIVVRND